MKIGMIGAGKIGGTLGQLLEDAGYDVRYGTRNPSASDAKGMAAAGAAQFGSVVIFAGPFGAWPDFAAENAKSLAGKVLIDASNPYPERDGPMAQEVIASGKGSAAYVASLLPGCRLIQTFNTVYWVDLRTEAGRSGERLAMPMVGNDTDALDVASRLARDAGFDPVVVGGLSRSIDLDPGSPIYAKSMTAAQVRVALGLAA